jgi:hypothetical protein
MRRAPRWIAGRLLPAALTAAGVALVVAGLLAWSDPRAIGAIPSAAPSIEPTAPPASPTPVPTLAQLPSIGPASPSVGPEVSLVPTPTPRTAVATRVVVPALGIDLPVVAAPPDETFPYCNVAEYSSAFQQPGLGGPVFVYAHARDGMFLPILDASKVSDGARMKGMLAQVYTSDDMVFLYEISDVYRRQDTLDAVFDSQGENLFLQTSEGPPKGFPGYTGTVVIVRAVPLGSQAADPKDARPRPRPVVCS